MGLIQGLHHVSLKCGDVAEFERAKKFYGEILGLKLIREWNSGASVMFDTGCGIIEIFATGKVSGSTGSVNHYAFLVNDPDSCIKTVRDAGYAVTVEPKNVVLSPDTNPLPIRVAFCIGPVGEEVEFFAVRE